MTRLLLALAVGATCLLAAGCSGGQGQLDEADAVETDVVTMVKSYRFDPEVISVDAGDTVTWKNDDNFTHDVTIELEGEEEGHTAKQGEDVKITFDEPGRYDYVCRLHETDMRGTVIVT